MGYFLVCRKSNLGHSEESSMLHMDREPYIQYLNQQHQQDVLNLKEKHRKAVQKLKKELRDAEQAGGRAELQAESLEFYNSKNETIEALKQESEALANALLQMQHEAAEAKREVATCKQDAEQVHLKALRPDCDITLDRCLWRSQPY